MKISFPRISVLLLLLALPTWSRADPLDVWHWLNPLPTGNNLFAITFGAGTFVAVDSAGTVLTSAGGVDWATRGFVSQPVARQAVTFGGGRFVAVGVAGGIFTSEDAATWTARLSGTTQTLASVSYGNGTFVAVGDGGTILSSTDGATWIPRNSGTNWPFVSVAFGNGNFVGVGGRVIVTSTDGTIWTQRSISSFLSGLGVVFGNGVFLADGFVSQSPNNPPGLWVSTNAVDWSRPSSYTPGSLIGVGFGVFLNYPPGGLAMATSTDGVIWNSHPFPAGTNVLRDAAYGNGVIIAVGNAGTVVRSTNAIDWSSINQGDRGFSSTSAAYGAGKYVLVGSTILTSTDGLNFNRLDGISSDLVAVTYANGKFLAVGNGGALMHSADGTAWSPGRSGTVKTLRGLAYGAGVYVAVGDGGSIRASSDGSVWTGEWSGTDYQLNSVVYAQGKFVAVGQFGIILTSSNGLDWLPQSNENLNTLQSVAFGQNKFVAVGQSGTVVTSTDGASWAGSSSGTTVTLISVSYGGGLFVTTGNSGSVFSSPDGSTWQKRNPGTVNDTGVAFLNGAFLLFGYNGTLLQSDPVGALSLNAKSEPAGEVEITISGGEPGQTYRLQACTNLSSPSWQDIMPFIQTQSLIRLIVPAAFASPTSYYRVIGP